MPRPNEYHWTFGNGAHLEFQNGTTLISHPATPMNTIEGCASISDPQSGALLFYTDGRTLWDANHNVISTDIGGHASSTHSAIIVPPPSGANNYHVFATSGFTYENDLIHSSYSVSGSGSSVNVQQVTPPTETFGDILTPERMAAVSNADCTGYWIVTQELDTDIFHTISLTTDTPVIMPPQTPGTPIQTRNSAESGYMKFSPNGKLLAYCDYSSNEVVICDFNNATGTLNYRHKIYEIAGPYGLEFSPDSQMIYFTAYNEDRLFQAPIGTVDIANTFSVLINDGRIPPDKKTLAALQLGPNDKIYALRGAEAFLAVINTPNATGLGCGYQDYEVDGNGNRIEVETSGQYGLPTFTRLSDNCVIDENGRCAQIADAVNTQLGAQAIENPNHLKPCDGTDPSNPVIDVCEPLDLPDIKPQISITWGDSVCDCIESDDLEVMTLTICNPYSNIALDHFTIHQLTVVDDQGNQVATLPNGQPSIQLVPVGPYCFGEIEPCSCISREFTLRNRGAIEGSYHIKIDGVCFDAHMHFDQTACFSFDICKD